MAKLIKFSAMPKIIGIQHPPQEDLAQIAEALKARGCTIFAIGRFAVSGEVNDVIYQTLLREKGTGDLALIVELEAPPPPVYFS